MKPLLPLALALAGLFVLHTQAQTPAPGDPFVKGPAGSTDIKPAEKKPPTLLLVYEVYALPQAAAADALFAESGGAALYRKVTELQKAGVGRLESLQAITSGSGQRCVLESVDEIRYPSAYDTSDADVAKKAAGQAAEKTPRGPANPAPINADAFETHQVGESFEIEPVISPDEQTVDVNLVPSRVLLQGFRDFPGQGKGQATTRPVFTSQKLITSFGLSVGSPGFLGTLSPAPVAGAAQEVWLFFLRVLTVPRPEAGTAQPANLPATVGGVRFEYSLFSCPKAEALDLVTSWPEAETPWTRLQALVQGKKARLEHLTSLVTRPGQRTVTEEVLQLPVPTVYAPPLEQGRGGNAVQFEPHQVGFAIELEPVLSDDARTVDINQVPSLTIDRGPLQYTGSATQYPAVTVIESRKLTTSGNFTVGKQMLVGTFNPPPANGVNGRTDDGRTWLLFVRCQLGNP